MEQHDYQMALLLQRQFEQEQGNNDDSQLAVLLQEQFEREVDVLKPTNGLTYDTKKRKLNDSKCLIDPSWELIDPTPDIYALFVAFNQRFFWDKLFAVCVSWSKRMTSCAGVCSYNRGACSITLSEPLLKLRPRKDLVETLLHEMIHAYLFVTHSRDNSRDGHGPEFQKHMFRINAEAGTNITIYHDFHDEVRLYQQHWWRCDGPCRFRKPYFGMVRRATNRAPGPYDSWWGEHSRTCGGQFVKVKEPEKQKKGQKGKENVKTVASPKNDIRNYFVNDNKKVTSTTVNGNSSKPRIVSFKDLKSPKMTNVTKNSSSTIVVTKTTTKNNTQDSKSTTKTTTKSFTKPTTTNSSKNNEDTKIDYSIVRNHWINKFSSNNCTNDIESVLPSTADLNKRQKLSSDDVENDDRVCCPVCSKKLPEKVLNEHLDVCLMNAQLGDDDCDKNGDYVKCLSCDQNIARSEIDVHFATCVSDVFDDTVEFVGNFIKCGKCGREIDKNFIDRHDKTCFKHHKSCLVCGRHILQEELNDHLEECVKIFDNNIEVGLENVGDAKEGDVKKYNCPVCMEMIEENRMDGHLDVCLHNNNGGDEKSDFNSAAFFDSFSEDF